MTEAQKIRAKELAKRGKSPSVIARSIGASQGDCEYYLVHHLAMNLASLTDDSYSSSDSFSGGGGSSGSGGSSSSYDSDSSYGGSSDSGSSSSGGGGD